ncbi:MAG: nuclear export factor [Aeromicrobium sp.]|uniref:YcnI family protein n=1 Tax=Aeromicrobium sp. TaxID=1871063 RepID=UPI00261DFA26|nr:YcnI family protein [Aeromicrobium sp.]MCW2825987.1 nuclear export factor [Aeromicrobium sp.]
MTRTTARLSAAFLTAALVAVAAPASAHVGVSTTDAAQGGYGKAVFRVPNESDQAATTKVVVTLPADQPFAFATAGAKPGWTVKVRKATLDKPTKVGDFDLTEAVRTITWTADGAGIPVGQFDEFALSGGPFPSADDITFTAEQTYDDGTTVAWDQPQTGDEEPEHPAPVLALAEATAGGHGTTEAGAHAEAETTGADDSELGVWLGGGALAVALAALVVALRENRRRA